MLPYAVRDSCTPQDPPLIDNHHFQAPQKVSALLGLDKITAPSDNAEPDPAPRVPILVDDVAGVASMVDDIAGLPSNPPSLYCDVEGVNLSRKGTVSIMQVHAAPSGKTYLVDVHLLQRRAFSPRGTTAGARTLRQLLEDADVPKVFFDVRNDSDALYAHFGVRLRGVQDLQLMEAAARPRRGRRAVAGLAQCIQSSPRIPDAEKKACARVKQAGLRLFSPKFGGTHEVFNRRPLGAEVMLYCAQDVEVLPRLWEHYDARIGRSWKGKVASASAVRVAESQARGYKSDGPNRALLPVTWLKSSRFH